MIIVTALIMGTLGAGYVIFYIALLLFGVLYCFIIQAKMHKEKSEEKIRRNNAMLS